MLKGITVTLHEKTQTGLDPFNVPVYTSIATDVDNVLVTPATAEDVISELNLSGKHLVYQLCIPKGDSHNWEDSKVTFMGQDFHTFGPVEEWIESMVPLCWNRKVKVERYGESSL